LKVLMIKDLILAILLKALIFFFFNCRIKIYL